MTRIKNALPSHQIVARTLLCFLAWGAFSGTATAEIKIYNVTGKEIKIDLETPEGDVSDVTIPRENGLSAVIGPATPRGEMERLTIRSADGKPLNSPCPVYSQEVVLLVSNGDSVEFRRAGYYKGKGEANHIRVINATGKELQYTYTDAQSDLQKGKVENDLPDYRDWFVAASAYHQPGQQLKVKFGVGQPANGEHVLGISGVYLATLAEGKLKFIKLGVD